MIFFPPPQQVEEAMTSLAKVQHLDGGFIGLYRQHIAELMDWVSLIHDCWTCYSPELVQLDVIATHSGKAGGAGLVWIHASFNPWASLDHSV